MKKLIFIISAILSVSSFAEIEVPNKLSNEIWKSVDIISKIEELPIIKTVDSKSYFEISNISCVFEMYEACSFFTEINGNNKMVVSLEGSGKFMQALVDAGIAIDEENTRLDVEKVTCSRSGTDTSCTLVEYNP